MFDIGKDLQTAYDIGYEHGLKKSFEWISVKDRLPPYNTYVLIYRPTMAIKILVDEYFGFYSDNGDEWFEGWAKFGKDLQGNPLITHWMPLPSLPNAEE